MLYYQNQRKDVAMTKYYFISFIHNDESGTTYGNCLMKAHNLDLTKIAWRLQTHHKFKNMPIILGLKDLSKKEFEMLKGKEI